MNLADRPDRCACMQQVLEDSPYPIFRQEAADVKTLKEKCPNVKLKSDPKPGFPAVFDPAASAVYCTNQLAFQTALDRKEKPDYIILVEDDLILKEGFWKKLRAFLNDDNCLSQEPWDLIAVDPFLTWKGLPDYNHKTFGDDSPGCSTLKMPHKWLFGAHIQIVRSSNLEKVVNRHPGITDHFNMWRKKGFEVRL